MGNILHKCEIPGANGETCKYLTYDITPPKNEVIDNTPDNLELSEVKKAPEITPQEALKVIDKAHDYPCPYGIGGTAWLYIRNCIEKQIPKKPIEKDEKDYWGNICDISYHCSVCGKYICHSAELSSAEEDYPHCHCGQVIDWSDTE